MAIIDTPEKWYHGEDGGNPARYCIATACGSAQDYPANFAAAIAAVSEHLGLEKGNQCKVFQWNDAPERTYQDVIGAMLTAAEALEARGE
jgi:hypothetical protein